MHWWEQDYKPYTGNVELFTAGDGRNGQNIFSNEDHPDENNVYDEDRFIFT